MEEVIKEIKRAEEKAAALIEEAEKEAAEISATLNAEIETLKVEYEEKLKAETVTVLNAVKEKIENIQAAQKAENSAKQDSIKSEVGDLKPCVDFVYDFIMKEFLQ